MKNWLHKCFDRWVQHPRRPGNRVRQSRSPRLESLEERVLLSGEPLATLPVLQSQNGALTTTLTAESGTSIINGRTVTGLTTFNGVYSGPTLQANPGDTLNLTVVNQLSMPTNLHTHGLHVSPLGNSDNVFLDIMPGEQNQYHIQIPATEPQGLYWFHPHEHGLVTGQIIGGLSGLLVIGQPDGGAPELAGLSQRVMALRDVQINQDGSINTAFSPSTPGATTHTLNGQVDPNITMAPGATEVWNIGNIGEGAFYNLQLQNAANPSQIIPFEVVAQDGQPFTQVKASDHLVMGSGNRFSFLVQVPLGTPAGTVFNLVSRPYVTGPFNWPNGVPSNLVLATLTVAGTAVTPFVLPTHLTPPNNYYTDLSQVPVAATRQIVFGQIPQQNGPPIFTINGQAFPDPTVIMPRVNTIEQWTIVNSTGETHTFHIHQNNFQVLSVNNQPLDPNGAALAVGQELYFGGAQMDTVDVPAGGSVVLRIDFKDFLGTFVYHCHITRHEDLGQMAIVEVVPNDPILAVGADAGSAPEVKVFDVLTGKTKFDFLAYEPTFTGGVRVATGDVNGDGMADIITVPGPGHTPLVHVYDGTDGHLLKSFLAGPATAGQGLFVAAGDINGDGKDDIIIGPDAGAAPLVQVFGALDGKLISSVMAFAPNFLGGVRVAAGDIDGDGRTDVIAAAGAGGPPEVKVFSGTTSLTLFSDFMAYDASFSGGVYVAVGRAKGFDFDDIVTAPGAGAQPSVKVWSMDMSMMMNGMHGGPFTVMQQNSFLAFDATDTSGVQVATLYDPAGTGDDVAAMDGASPEHLRLFRTGSLTQFQSPINNTPTQTLISANERFVMQLYLDLLHRNADSPGLNFWTDALDHGSMNRTQVALGIQGSEEYRTQVVQGLYQTFLKRAADPAGLSTFIGFLGSGGTIEQAQALIVGSPEYLTKNGGTNQGFLQGLFQDALHRPLDTDGSNAFLPLLQNGMLSRTQVASLVFASSEYQHDVVQNDYLQFLGRAAGLREAAWAASVLAQGNSDQLLAALIAGSAEYFGRV